MLTLQYIDNGVVKIYKKCYTENTPTPPFRELDTSPEKGCGPLGTLRPRAGEEITKTLWLKILM